VLRACSGLDFVQCGRKEKKDIVDEVLTEFKFSLDLAAEWETDATTELFCETKNGPDWSIAKSLGAEYGLPFDEAHEQKMIDTIMSNGGCPY